MKSTLFKIVTGIGGIYHLILGLSGLLLPASLFSKVSGIILGVSPNMDAQFQMVAKFSAAYLLAFGIMLLLLAKDPIRNRVLLIPALTLFGVRIINKMVFFGTINSAFGIPESRTLFGIVSLIAIFACILLTMPGKASQES